jgi:DNA-binding PadR family transcriptional regulator
MVVKMRHYDEGEGRHGRMGMMGNYRGHSRGFGLRYWILSIVGKEPSTGSMIMDKVERMSMGHWRPSPGQIYPLLEQMSEDGDLKVENRDGKKFYSVTDKGREFLEGSWFPWRTAGGLTGFNGLNEAVENMETIVEYVLDNREKIEADENLKGKISGIVERLKTIK